MTDTLYGTGQNTGSDVDFNEEVARLREARRVAPRMGPGQRAAIVVVDLQRAFMDVEDPDAAGVLAAVARLLGATRAANVPAFFSAMVLPTLDDVNERWRTMHDMTAFMPGAPSGEIHPAVAMAEGEVLVGKAHASSFHGTSLDEQLRELAIDTVLVTGTSTSGCVRATAIDAAARDYRTVVIEDCCYDPRPLSREATLWDLADRYADVVRLDDVIAMLPQLS